MYAPFIGPRNTAGWSRLSVKIDAKDECFAPIFLTNCENV